MSLRIVEERVGPVEAIEAFAPAEHREERATLRAWLENPDPRGAPRALAGVEWVMLHGALHAYPDEIDVKRLAGDRSDLAARLRADKIEPLGVVLELFYNAILGALKLETERREADRFTDLRRSRSAWSWWKRAKLGEGAARSAIEALLAAIDARGDVAHERDARRRRLLAAPPAELQEIPPRRRRRDGARLAVDLPDRIEFELDLPRRPLRWIARLVDLLPGGDMDPRRGRRPRDPVVDGHQTLMQFLVKVLGLETTIASKLTSELLGLFVQPPSRAPRRRAAWPPPPATIRRDWARFT